MASGIACVDYFLWSRVLYKPGSKIEGGAVSMLGSEFLFPSPSRINTRASGA